MSYYSDGLDVLARKPKSNLAHAIARLRAAKARASKHAAEVLGIDEFDKSNAYSAGDVVTYSGDWWRATRDISSVGFFSGGEVPGKSDAWRVMTPSEISDSWRRESVKGDVVGTYDLKVEQDKFNQLKQVPISIARALLKGGQAAIDEAIKGAKQPWYKPDLTGATNRSNVKAHLEWHANALSGLTDTNAMYASGQDEIKWVRQAFIEANSVEAGNETLNAAWDLMWIEVAASLKALPREIADRVGSTIWGILPWYAWAGIAVGGAGLLYGIFRVLVGPVGQQAVGTALGIRLSERR